MAIFKYTEFFTYLDHIYTTTCENNEKHLWFNFYNVWLSWKCFNTNAHEVSSQCVLLLASLRSKEVNLEKNA